MDVRDRNSVEGRPPDPALLVAGNQSQHGLSENFAGSGSRIEELLEGSISRIDSNMVAPLLGTIYGDPLTQLSWLLEINLNMAYQVI